MDQIPSNTPTDRAPDPPEPGDPRLAIPEILRERPGSTPPPAKKPENFADTAKAWGMGLDLVFTTIGGLALGWAFDWWRGTGPWGAIIGLGVGFLTSTTRLIRSTLKAEAREQADRERHRK